MKEERATGSKLIDTSIIVDYFVHGTFKNIIEGDESLLISCLSLFETKKILNGKNVSKEEIEENINFIKKRVISVDVNNIISEKSADLSIIHKIPSIDSIIYTTALLNNAVLLTLDNDFRGLKNAVVFDKN